MLYYLPNGIFNIKITKNFVRICFLAIFAEYRTLRRKAMLNENVVHSDENGNPILVPAREVFTKLYNEPVPTF